MTFPARQYSVNGERRSFARLGPITDTETQNRIRDSILSEFERSEAQARPGVVTAQPGLAFAGPKPQA